MSKSKLEKYAEIKLFKSVIDPTDDDFLNGKYRFLGKWCDHFKNENPIVLELGCGNGDYAISLAARYPDCNFVGVDIKGTRIWNGAKYVEDNGISNVLFLRTTIDKLDLFFAPDELNEIWITFPEPEFKRSRFRKRVIACRFLNLYAKILKPNGAINLKTDSDALFVYMNSILQYNNIVPEFSFADLYSESFPEDALSIKTKYERKFLGVGQKIKYVRFSLPDGMILQEPPDEE